MKESHREGVADHPDRESCGVHREVQPEALTGAHAGWVLSFENIVRERRRCQDKRKAKRAGSKTRDPGRLPGVGDPRHAWKLSAREPGDPDGARRPEKATGRKGNPQGHALHARHREVGPLRSTGEGSEQTRQGLRRDWREGGGSRRTRWKTTRTVHRNGRPCHRDYRACVRQLEGTKDYPYPLERFYANIRDKSRVR